jgi:hypothetical protein
MAGQQNVYADLRIQVLVQEEELGDRRVSKELE